MPRELSPVREPDIIILGVFGNNSKMTEHEVQDKVLNPIMDELGRYPDRVLVPSEGTSSIFIQEWAEMNNIQCQAFYTDWVRNGRIAQILRDDRIKKECTHAIVFLSPKSNKQEKVAEGMAKKGKVVFTSSYQNHELEQLVLEQQQKASGRARKLDRGIEQMWQKYQKKAEC